MVQWLQAYPVLFDFQNLNVEQKESRMIRHWTDLKWNNEWEDLQEG